MYIINPNDKALRDLTDGGTKIVDTFLLLGLKDLNILELDIQKYLKNLELAKVLAPNSSRLICLVNKENTRSHLSWIFGSSAIKYLDELQYLEQFKLFISINKNL